jgi:CTP:molybdopterin cytidylyltransferase MocA
MPTPAIILAAGASRRLGRPKQLVEFQGEALLERAVRIASEAGAKPVMTVLGANFELICAAIPQGDSVRVLNDRWESGIAGSIHAGLHALDSITPKAAGALLMTCDQPRLTAAHLRALLEVFNAQSEPAIVASSYAGATGIPAIFPRELFGELRKLLGDTGARALLAKASCPVIAIELEGGEVDIDLPEDIAQLE